MNGRTRSGRVLASLGVALCAAAIVVGRASPARADTPHNACGCYKDDVGNCYCDKKARCGCPGECEPKGCEEKRDRELEKEIESETKRAEESARKQGGAAAPAPVAPPPPEKKEPARPAARPLAPKQQRDLARLLRLYVAGHPGSETKTAQELIEEMGAGNK